MTVPETLASPDSSALPATDCAAASRAEGNRLNATASSGTRTRDNAFFMTGSFVLAREFLL